MIFAFATDDKTITVFSDESEAISYCEGYDVAQGGWLFFANDGSPLEHYFEIPASTPGTLIAHGRYSLRASTADNAGHLLHLLPRVTSVEGYQPLTTVADINAHISHYTNGPGNRMNIAVQNNPDS